MKLVVGLGNPGPQYRFTRHNVGFRVLDLLAERMGAAFNQEKYGGLVATAEWNGTRTMLLKPLTYMNLSGSCVAKAVRNRVRDLSDLLVIVDEIYLPLGVLRIREEGSAGGHNGMKSIIEHLDTQAFPRLRIGVGDKQGGQPLRDHVLSMFRPEEKTEVEEALKTAAEAALCFVDHGVRQAMAAFNRRKRLGEERQQQERS